MSNRFNFYLYLTIVILSLVGSPQLSADARLQARLYFAMNAPDRPEGDIDRDPDRKPGEVLDFFGIQSGMTVLDIMAGTGYYSEMLSAAVGYDGKVYAQNDIMIMRNRYGAIEKIISKRLAGNRLPNVEILTQYITDLEFQESIDAATLILNLHDLYIFGGEEETLNALNSIMLALKPGGILGIVDHVGAPDQENNYLHRIDPVTVEDLLFRAGFIVTGRTNILSNPKDDHTLHAFEADIRGKTDRLVIRAIKPNYSSIQR
jgi:predicted methyltransferase